jgi:antirestriction protein
MKEKQKMSNNNDKIITEIAEELKTTSEAVQDMLDDNCIKDYEYPVIHYLASELVTLDSAIEQRENVTYYADQTLEEVARELVAEGIYGSVDDILFAYIDFEHLARDLSMEGYVETDYGVFKWD